MIRCNLCGSTMYSELHTTRITSHDQIVSFTTMSSLQSTILSERAVVIIEIEIKAITPILSMSYLFQISSYGI